MAFGMKQWIAAMVLGCALVAAWRLPPEPVDSHDRAVVTGERIRFDALHSEIRTTSAILFRTLWADSLSAEVVAEAEDGLALLTPSVNEAVAAQRSRLAEQIRVQLERRPEGRSKMIFGYVVQPFDHRREDGAAWPRERTETYVGTRDGADYCLQVRVVHPRSGSTAVGRRLIGSDDFVTPRDDELGPCRFYLGYGFAGPRVQEWLEAGGLEFAYEPAAAAPLDFERRENRRRGVFGIDRAGAVSAHGRCLAGVEESCEALFTDLGPYLLTEQQREIVRGSPATGLGSSFNRIGWVRAHRHILADLEAEFGVEAFRRFWTSDEAVDDAFASAFGLRPGAWLVQRIERYQGIDAPGPGVPQHTSSMAMLTITAFLGIAYWRRRERKVVS